MHWGTAALLAVAALHAGVAHGEDAKPDPLTCEHGPVPEIFGKLEWAMFSCTDGKTLVLYSADNTPTFEFYFILFPEAGSYRLYGEGIGDRDKTAPAYEELTLLSATEIAALISETRSRPAASN